MTSVNQINPLRQTNSSLHSNVTFQSSPLLIQLQDSIYWKQRLEHKTALALISLDGEGFCLPRGDFVYSSLLQAHILTGIAKRKH